MRRRKGRRPRSFRITVLSCLVTISSLLSLTLLTLAFRPSGCKSENTPLPRNIYPTQIVVLAMNRSETLANLLDSLRQTNFDGDKVHLQIHIDLGAHREETVLVANRFNFPHGSKSVILRNQSQGLAASWYSAWYPRSAKERGIIFEDDIIVSPDWYTWLKSAWNAYEHMEDMAGITLQRQTLVPYPTMIKHEIVNSNEPFLYPLVGSIGFSPNAKIWQNFIQWINTISTETFDVTTPGLVTSEWWNTLDKRHMWTQHFIYFCLQQGLHTLYVNLPRQETIAAHVRARGAHYALSQGPDFPTAKCITRYFPENPIKFDWDGNHLVLDKRPARTAASQVLQSTFLRAAKRISHQNTFVPLVLVNSQSIDTVKMTISRSKTASPEKLKETIFVSTSYAITRDLLKFEPAVSTLTLSVEEDSARCPALRVCRSEFQMLAIQDMLTQEGLSFSIITHSYTEMENERQSWRAGHIFMDTPLDTENSKVKRCDTICHTDDVAKLQTFYSTLVEKVRNQLKVTRPEDCGTWFGAFISEAVNSAPENVRKLLKCCS